MIPFVLMCCLLKNFDAFALHADATRQRGTTILSSAGNQRFITYTLPYSATYYIIMPGTFVYWAWPDESKLGIVRSVSVTTNFPEINTTIEIEANNSLGGI